MKLAKLQGQAEIFHSIQGEGVSLGVPSVFVRLSLCNLHCHWCDTDYTWNWQGTPWTHQSGNKFDKAEMQLDLSPREVADRVAGYDCENIVLSGGEPLLQADELAELISHLRGSGRDYRFEVETNGTRDPGPLWDLVDQFNVSPKLSNSNNDAKLRIVPELLKAFAESDKAWFKFVVAAPEDLDEIQALEATYGLPKKRILLMPEGTTAEQLQAKRQWLAEICRDQKYRLGDRLHVNIWGAKRGV